MLFGVKDFIDQLKATLSGSWRGDGITLTVNTGAYVNSLFLYSSVVKSNWVGISLIGYEKIISTMPVFVTFLMKGIGSGPVSCFPAAFPRNKSANLSSSVSTFSYFFPVNS